MLVLYHVQTPTNSDLGGVCSPSDKHRLEINQQLSEIPVPQTVEIDGQCVNRSATLKCLWWAIRAVEVVYELRLCTNLCPFSLCCHYRLAA